ncbi:MAG TPA: enoyl-CoA hydratase [Castellaniella sp.]|uniref:enoyl-CoA hydratase n=1 Tax=Castellaniella sp. TaxID=1955812 RepID=UPI002EE68DC1
MSESLVKVEVRGRVGVLTLNRPKVLNALSNDVITELAAAVRVFEADENIGAMVLTGNEKAFAAGADISAMAGWSYMDVYKADYLGGDWEALRHMRKPIIAAVAGYALGGGCELAMLCDFIIAADNAKFGQPEIKLGVIPGYGGTQRLPRAVGKAKAMDLVLTGRMMDVHEAERAGLVARIVTPERLLDEAVEAATVIASMSLPSVMMAKESVNRAFESSLSESLLFERRNFHALFATDDQKEGMRAFVEKRKPDFKHR